MGAIVPEWIGDVFTKALGYAFLPEDQQPSEEELSAMYMDSLNSAIDNHAGDVVTNTVDVTLSLVDDEWKINATDDVIDAMVGGMMSSFSSLGDSFGGLEESSEPTETVRTNPANLGDYTVEIKSATVTQDYDGNPAVIITYSWTNNSSETTSPMLSISTAVFQDGIGMDSAFIYDDPAYDGDMYMLADHFSIEVQFVAVFVIDFCSVGCTGYQQGRDHHCQNIALHHYLLPSLIFFI